MLHVTFLGEQAIIDSETGDAVSVPSRALTLLAYLVVHAGMPQPRHRLATLFLPDSPDTQALTNLRRELHHLRRALAGAPDLVVTTTDLCWRDGACEVDVRTFDAEHTRAIRADDDAMFDIHATAALGAYRGAFLPGCDDDWADPVRTGLEQECVDLCDRLAAARRRADDRRAAAELMRRRIRMRPLEETGYRLLMEIQAELGDRSGAVRTYHRCAAVLERELDVEPDPVTRDAFQRLLGDGIVHAPRDGGARAPAPPLVGRDTAVATLTDVWDRASAGRAELVVVTGDAGVGKTRLVTEFARGVRRRGAVVAAARCFAGTERLPLAPVVDWLRDPVLGAACRQIDPQWRAAVDLLMSPGRAGRGGEGAAGAWRRTRFVEGLARALVAAARPTVLVLDDLQWCDGDTLDVLHYLVGALPRAPVLIAATMRNEDVDPARRLGLLAASAPVTTVELGPLDAASAADLADRLAGRSLTGAEHALLLAGTGGFPLHLLAAMQSGVVPGAGDERAARLQDLLGSRLAGLGADAAAVVALTAAAGRDVSLDLLVEAGDLDPVATVRAVDVLWRQRILRETGRGYDFTHDLLRDAAYQRINPPQRWLLHRRLAQGIELLHGDDLDPYSAQLARQYDRGGRPDRAVPHYLRAAELATATYGYDDAVRLNRAAVTAARSLPDSVGARRHELAALESSAAPLTASRGYASPELQASLERAVDLAEQLGQREQLAAGLVGLWSSRFVQGRNVDAERVASRALAVAQSTGDGESLGAAHFACGGSAVSLARPEEALVHFEAADALTPGGRTLWVGARYDVHGRAWVAHALWLCGRFDDARAAATTAVALARTDDQPYTLAVALAYGAVTQQLLGDSAALTRTVDELGKLCDRYAFAYYREWGMVLDGWLRGDTGPVADGVERLRATGAFARMPYWLWLLADVHARAGRTGTARAILDAALTAARSHTDRWWLPQIERSRNDLA
ncbi:ATP-binding protein [Rhodococcus triatomae]|nr:SARP family transcriptional regulator fused with ATPase domain [Rhodococcus triatomae BKS 15-14]